MKFPALTALNLIRMGTVTGEIAQMVKILLNQKKQNSVRPKCYFIGLPWARPGGFSALGCPARWFGVTAGPVAESLDQL